MAKSNSTFVERNSTGVVDRVGNIEIASEFALDRIEQFLTNLCCQTAVRDLAVAKRQIAD